MRHAATSRLQGFYVVRGRLPMAVNVSHLSREAVIAHSAACAASPVPSWDQVMRAAALCSSFAASSDDGGSSPVPLRNAAIATGTIMERLGGTVQDANVVKTGRLWRALSVELSATGERHVRYTPTGDPQDDELLVIRNDLQLVSTEHGQRCVGCHPQTTEPC
jgi:hypothetical protein